MIKYDLSNQHHPEIKSYMDRIKYKMAFKITLEV